MKDNFDSLIYIIITLVAFAFSLLGKKKKKTSSPFIPKQNNEPVQKAEKPFLSNLEKLLNEQLGYEDQNMSNQFEEDKPIYEPKPEREEILDSPVSSLDNTDEILDSVPEEMKDGKKDIYSVEFDDTSEIFNTSIKDGELKTEEEESSTLDDFDIEDAIIYSEIINRKEY